MSSKLKTVLLLVGVPIGMIALVILLGMAMMWSAEEMEPSPTEALLVVGIDQLAPWVRDFQPRPGRGTLRKLRYFDGSFEVEYEYDDPQDQLAPYLYSLVTVEQTRSDAQASYVGAWTGTQAGWALAGEELGVEEAESVFSWGEQSYFAFLTVDGERVGNYFLGRDGFKVVELTLVGIAFEDEEEMTTFLGPSLEQVKTFKP